MSRLRIVLSVIVVLALAACASAQKAEIGAAAPDFKLTSVEGTEHSLSEFRGKFVVLEWTNYDCPFVRKHYEPGHMQGLQKEFTSKGVIWLSICSSAPGKQGHFSIGEWKSRITRWGSAPTAVLLDPEGVVGRAYDARTTPHMFVVNPEGILIYAGAIDDKPTADSKDIPGARNYVRAALEQAMAGQPVEVPTTKPYGCSVKY